MRNYVWREGDTLMGVALRLGQSPRAIRAANPTTDFDALTGGVEIRLPLPGVDCPIGGVHTVRRGQSITSIARLLGVTPMSLLNANPYVDPMELSVGEVLIAPEREFCRCRYGDTMAAVASRYGVHLSRLAQLNPRLPPGALPPGALLRLRRAPNQ